MAKQHQEDPWAGFVDVLSNVLMAVTFLIIILGIAIFGMSQQIAQKAQADVQKQAEARNAAEKKLQEATGAISQVNAELAAAQQKAELAQQAVNLSASDAQQKAAEASARAVDAELQVKTLEAKLEAMAAEKAALEAARPATPPATPPAEATPPPPPPPAAPSPSAAELDAAKAAAAAAETRAAAAEAKLTEMASQKAAEGSDKANERETAGAYKPALDARIAQVDEPDGNSQMTVRSRRDMPSKELTVAAEEVAKEDGSVNIAASQAVLTLKFGKGLFKIDTGSKTAVADFIKENADALSSGQMEIRAFAQSTVGSISEARRIAYYRAMSARNLLIAGGIDSTRVRVLVRESTSAEELDVVRVFIKP